jgi:hypothetical protein
VERIGRKIAQAPFVRDPAFRVQERRWWGFRGGLAGLVAGFLVGVGLCLAGRLGYKEVIVCGGIGGFAGMLAGLSVPGVWKPIWTAIFCDVRRFEREYGDQPALPPPYRRGGRSGAKP